MAKIAAIETRYGGRRYRSRLEARYAVLFDALGIENEYEREGYKLPSGFYLPDFWLPEARVLYAEGTGVWAEIKGLDPNPLETTLALELGLMTGKPALILAGSPKWDFPKWRQICDGREEMHEGPMLPMRHADSGLWMFCSMMAEAPEGFESPWIHSKFDHAIEAANSARFDGSDGNP